jgi:3-oxoacyl-[acyl-carrier protein] reductase
MDTEAASRIVVVTGAARGIGAATATAFAAAGDRVHLLDRDASGVRERAARIGPACTAHVADVGVEREVRAAIGAVLEAHGRLDVLVNNAGEIVAGPFDTTDSARWESMLRTNLTGLFHCVQAAAPAMRARRAGAIVNIASVSAERGGGAVGNVWYGATKAAVVAATKGLARELGPHGVRVNAISPGLARTALTEPYLDAATEARLLARFPLGRLAQPEEIARLALFLASDDAGYLTGQTVALDGGFLAT